MRARGPLFAAAMLCGLIAAGCGSSDQGPVDFRAYRDGDDTSIDRFGHRASANERQAIVTVVDRYFTAAASRDGKRACKMMDPFFQGTVAASYGQKESCATFMTKIFDENHAKLTRMPQVLEVLVKDDYASVVVGSYSFTPRYVGMHRYHGAWTVEDTLGTQFT